MPQPLLVVILLALGATAAAAAPVATNLQATCRDGQVFLTWDEPAGLQGDLTVLMSKQPITAADQATVIAEGVNPGSAYDWWLNKETYGNPVPKDPNTGEAYKPPHEGFIVTPGGPRLNPDSGLHVHTVAADEAGAAYYAVIGADNKEIVAGQNSLAQPVNQQAGAVTPIWQSADSAPEVEKAKGLPLHLILHAKTGIGGMEYLAFGDKSLGWREGLPFKFGVRVTPDYVEVRPTDRTWIGRMFPEGTDGCQKLTPAIHSFWYGYNSNIHWPERMAQGVCTNYSERRVLWIVDWVQRTYQTDPNRTYATGSSMGGCGMMAVALRHPEVFAAISAHVPIVAYDKGPGGDSLRRITAECGDVDKPCNEGMSVRDRLDATRFVREHKGDLPFLVIANGRTDTSIPWWKNPDFYRTMRDQRQAFVAAWNDGDHGGCGSKLPPDIRQLADLRNLHQYALDRSYLAFSNSSQDQNPGNGDAKDGDIEGYMNRGLVYDPPADAADRYEVLIKWALEADKLPVTVDVTPRRLQALKLKPGDQVTAMNLAADGTEVQKLTLTADDQGLVTFPAFKVISAAGNRLVLTKSPERGPPGPRPLPLPLP